MNIWTIKEGEPLPIKECPGRQMRCGIISEMLSERGHDVTWWTSDFFHQTKTRLRNAETVIDLGDHYRLHMLHAGTIYKKNVSFQRIKYSEQLGKAFAKAAEKEEQPDLIFCAFPLIDFAYEAVKYGKKKGVPVIVDVRDFWPDIFWDKYSKPIQVCAKIACRGLTKKTEYALKNATEVVGIIPKSIRFAKEHGRFLLPEDRVYSLAYAENEYSQELYDQAYAFWERQGVYRNDSVVCWIGSIHETRTDFRLVLDVLAKYPRIKMVVCGDGPSTNDLRTHYAQYPNIVFPGFLDNVYLKALMNISSIGVIPIRDSAAFIDTLNNKAVEYMAGGLCIATSLSGLQKTIVEDNSLGFYFSDSSEFEDKLMKHLSDQALLKKCKHNSRLYFENNFKSGKIYGELCDHFEQIIMN